VIGPSESKKQLYELKIDGTTIEWKSRQISLSSQSAFKQCRVLIYNYIKLYLFHKLLSKSTLVINVVFGIYVYKLYSWLIHIFT
jgi:hypothetical protein